MGKRFDCFTKVSRWTKCAILWLGMVPSCPVPSSSVTRVREEYWLGIWELDAIGMWALDWVAGM